MPFDDRTESERRASGRAELSAEERAVGSDDPEAQAKAILAESDERAASMDAPAESTWEHRTSDDATLPPD